MPEVKENNFVQFIQTIRKTSYNSGGDVGNGNNAPNGQLFTNQRKLFIALLIRCAITTIQVMQYNRQRNARMSFDLISTGGQPYEP